MEPNVFDLIQPPPATYDRPTSADLYGFCDMRWSDADEALVKVDIPIPASVDSWTEAIRYAAREGVVLWSQPSVWEIDRIRRRLASVRTMAVREGLHVETKRDWSEERLYFHIVVDPEDLWTRRPEPTEPTD